MNDERMSTQDAWERFGVEWNILVMLVARATGVVWVLDRLEALLTRINNAR